MDPRSRFAVVVLGWTLLQPVWVFAQTEEACTSDDTTPLCVALRLFSEAEAARADRRFGDARDLLARSLALDPAAPTAFNLAGILTDTGEYVGAVDLYDELQAGEFGEIPQSRLERIRERSREAEQRIATILVRARIDTAINASVDGELLREATSAQTFDLRVNPGRRHIRIAAVDGSHQVTRTLEIEPGATAAISFERPAPPPQPPDRHPVPAPEEEALLLESPWFWAVAGLLVAGGVAALLVLTLTPDPTVVVDPVLGNVGTLRF